MSDGTPLLTRISEAAAQASLMKRRQQDLDLMEQGWRIRHAVDSNVLGSFLNPAEDAKKGPNRRMGVGEVFESDPLALSISIATLVTKFVFFNIEQKPLLILPPIHSEYADILSREGNVTEEKSDVELEVLLNKILTRLRMLKYRPRPKDSAIILTALSLDSAPASATVRRLELISKDRVVSLDTPGMEKREDQVFADVFQRWSVLQLGPYMEASKIWSDMFDTIGRRDGRARERDVSTLARLQVWNASLEPHRAKIVYITEDASILKAASLLPTNGVERNFGELYIRHPRSYLDEALQSQSLSTTFDEVKQDVPESSTIAGWFTILLGRFQGVSESAGRWGKDGFELNDGVQKTIAKVEEQDPDLSRRVRDDWLDFVSKALGGVTQSVSFEQQVIRAAESNIESLASYLDDLEGKLAPKWQELWSNFAGTVTDTRFLIEVCSVPDVHPRTLLEPCFDNYALAQNFLKKALGWLNSGGFDGEEYQNLRDELFASTCGEYYFYLVISFVLADRQHWHSAANLAEFASQLISFDGERKLPARSSGMAISGREAKLFEAYFRRHRARDAHGTRKCADLLREARYGAELDIENFKPRYFDPVIERIENEEIALEITECMFKWAEGHDQTKAWPELENIREKIKKFRGKIVERLARIKFEEFEDHVIGISDRQRMLRNILYRTASNTIWISLLLRPVEHDLEVRVALDLLEEQAAQLDRTGRAGSSSFMREVILNAGRASYAADPQTRANGRNWIRRRLSPAELRKDNNVFPYDPMRFLFIYERLSGPRGI